MYQPAFSKLSHIFHPKVSFTTWHWHAFLDGRSLLACDLGGLGTCLQSIRCKRIRRDMAQPWGKARKGGCSEASRLWVRMLRLTPQRADVPTCTYQPCAPQRASPATWQRHAPAGSVPAFLFSLVLESSTSSEHCAPSRGWSTFWFSSIQIIQAYLLVYLLTGLVLLRICFLSQQSWGLVFSPKSHGNFWLAFCSESTQFLAYAWPLGSCKNFSFNRRLLLRRSQNVSF